MFFLIYNLASRSVALGIRLSALWNPKAKLWVRGRKHLLSKIRDRLKNDDRPVVWMHSASLGEFEQGRSLIEAVRKIYPSYAIVVTFFSPSGYEVVKDYPGADYIFYLPAPSGRNARQFLDVVRPSLVLWIKYDYWFPYLRELENREIPVLLISAVFHRGQAFFKWYGKMYKKMLNSFTWIFVQDQASQKKLETIGFSRNVTVGGDTRFDRVTDIAEQTISIPEVEAFIGNAAVVVAGSTWREDEEHLDHYANTRTHIKFIIAPHEIYEEHLKDIEKLFENSVRFSQLTNKPVENINTLIIDNIGMLSRLYRYSTVAYIGGGFGNDGVHNVLEAAVFAKPVVFGPVFNQFREAIDLLEEGAAFTVNSALELEQVLDELLRKDVHYRECCEAARNYVFSQRGATGRIMDYIQANRLLIN